MSPRKPKAPVAEELQQNRNVDGAKRAVLDKAVGDILKRFGEGSIMPLGLLVFEGTCFTLQIQSVKVNLG